MIKSFSHKIKNYLIAICLFTLQSCASIEHKPLISGHTTATVPKIYPNVTDGSLFQETVPINYNYHPLFEDHRPHNIGDIITVAIQENVNASNSSSLNISRGGSSNIGMVIAPGQLNSALGTDVNENKTALNGTGKNDFLGKGSKSIKHQFTGLITVTINKVLSNGNFSVIGEKKVAINNGIECIRFSGIINPNHINKNNLISSAQVADARIEYSSNGTVNDSQDMGWLQKFLLKISPV